MVLLFDIGNTFTKIATNKINKGSINLINTNILTTSESWNDLIKENLLDILKNEKIVGSVICSVVPEKTNDLINLINEVCRIKPILVNNQIFDKLPIKVKLNNQQIGSDFIAMAVGADSYYGDSIIVSLGTATTYSIVRNHELIGGIIGPGFISAKNSLIANASQIQSFIISPYNSVIGKDTNHALSIGFGNGFSYMISTTIEKIIEEMNNVKPLTNKIKIIVTGGAYLELEPFLKFNYCAHPNILMYGLAQIYKLLTLTKSTKGRQK